MKACPQAVGSPHSQGSPLHNSRVSLPPPAPRLGLQTKKMDTQPALVLLLHCDFIGFSLMVLSLSQKEAGWEVSHKTKASQLMNSAPGGKGHRSSSCSWSQRAELAFDSLARTESLLAGRGKVRSASSAIHFSGATHEGGIEISSPELVIPTPREFSSTLRWRGEPEISQVQPPPNKCAMLPPLGWFCSSLFSFLLS